MERLFWLMDHNHPAHLTAAVAFARDLMVSNLGQMPYESEFGKLKLEAVWGRPLCRDSTVTRM